MSPKALIKVMRLRTLPLAVVGIGFGLFATNMVQEINWLLGGLTLATAILLQIFSNIANDYGDFHNGADGHREDRATASGSITIAGMKVLLWVFGLASFTCGLLLLFFAFPHNIMGLLLFLALGILCLLGAYKYTAGNKPYGYAAMGDIAVFLFFGLIAVVGTFFLQTKIFSTPPFVLSIAVGLLSVSVLNINNMRDIETDMEAGKKTLASKFGLANALFYQKTLYAISLACLAYYAYINSYRTGVILAAIFYIVFFFFHKKLWKTLEHHAYTQLLKINVFLILGLSVLYWFLFC